MEHHSTDTQHWIAEQPIVQLVRRYGRPYRGTALIGIGVQILGRIPERIPAFLIGLLIDAVLRTGGQYDLPLIPTAWLPTTQLGQLWLTVGLLAASYPTLAVFEWVSSTTYGRFDHGIIHDIRTDTYDHLQRRSLSWFDREETGEAMSILNNDVNNLEVFLGGGIKYSVRFISFLGVAYGFMFVLSPVLAGLLLLVPLIVAVITKWFSAAMAPRYEAVRDTVGQLNGLLRANVSGIATIKSHTTGAHEIERVSDASASYRDRMIRTIRPRVLLPVTTRFVERTGFTGILLLGGYWSLQSVSGPFGISPSPGALVTFLLYADNLAFPMQQLVNYVDDYQNARASAQRILGVLDSQENCPAERGPIDRSTFRGRVEFDDVSFRYADTEASVLTEIDFTAEPGSFVGIVGPSGAGKSTLVKLLLGLYTPETGTIAIDRTPLDQLTTVSFRKQVGYVSQEPFLIDGTAIENIAYGCSSVDDAVVKRAAHAAGAHTFIRKLPCGYETELGESGESLSGGQRQRLVIARALAADPDILVLDEATSHVDMETEVAIQQNLQNQHGQRTIFAVAHRLSTIIHADLILVLNGGTIVERGTHEELLAQDGLYARLWHTQTRPISALSESIHPPKLDQGEDIQ